MLKVTPEALSLIRARERAEAARRPRKPRKLRRDRRAALVALCARFMRAEWAEGRAPTKFTHESAVRHVLRSRLCLTGWRWDEADAAALDVVAAAERVIRAVRPSWDEGQPDWTKAGPTIERTRCARCGRGLPEGHKLWCGDVCARAAKWDRAKGRRNDARMPA